MVELYEGDDFVCSGYLEGEVFLTAGHCVDRKGEYRVLKDGRVVKTFRGSEVVIEGDLAYVGKRPRFAPLKVGDVAVIRHMALSKKIELRGEVLWVGTVGDLRIAIDWLSKDDRIALVRATTFAGCSGSPVFVRWGGRWRVAGVVSGGGAGMTIVAIPK